MFWWETKQRYADVFRILNVPISTGETSRLKGIYPVSLCYVWFLWIHSSIGKDFFFCVLWWEIKKGKTLSWIFFIYANSFFHVYTTFYFMFWWETNQGYADVFRILNVPTPTDASKEYTRSLSVMHIHYLGQTFTLRFHDDLGFHFGHAFTLRIHVLAWPPPAGLLVLLRGPRDLQTSRSLCTFFFSSDGYIRTLCQGYRLTTPLTHQRNTRFTSSFLLRITTFTLRRHLGQGHLWPSHPTFRSTALFHQDTILSCYYPPFKYVSTTTPSFRQLLVFSPFNKTKSWYILLFFLKVF